MTDDELIARFARCDDYDTVFDPLTDWNHTMEVVEKMPRPFHLLHLNDGASWQAQCSDKQLYIIDKNPQRAICLASLLAVSP